VVVICFKKHIRLLFEALVCLMNRITKMEIKDLTVVLTSKDVPAEVKILLTQDFVNNRRQEKLATLSAVIKSLRLLQPCIMKFTKFVDKAMIDKVIDDMEKLRDALVQCAPEEAMLIQSFLVKLREKPVDILQRNFPIMNAFDQLDPNWPEKDPEDFQELVRIRNIILGNRD
jgi:hypothetical protein